MSSTAYALVKILANFSTNFGFKYIIKMISTLISQSLQSLWANERLLNLAEQILGHDVWGHPVWNLRPKVPRDEVTTVPWHQGKAHYNYVVSLFS